MSQMQQTRSISEEADRRNSRRQADTFVGYLYRLDLAVSCSKEVDDPNTWSILLSAEGVDLEAKIENAFFLAPGALFDGNVFPQRMPLIFRAGGEDQVSASYITSDGTFAERIRRCMTIAQPTSAAGETYRVLGDDPERTIQALSLPYASPEQAYTLLQDIVSRATEHGLPTERFLQDWTEEEKAALDKVASDDRVVLEKLLEGRYGGQLCTINAEGKHVAVYIAGGKVLTNTFRDGAGSANVYPLLRPIRDY